MTRIATKLKAIINNPRYRDLAKLGLLFLWIGVIFYFSSLPSLFPFAQHPVEVIPRKLAHFFEYGLLVFLLFKVISIYRAQFFGKNLGLAVTLSILFAISDEYHQAFVFGRHAAVTDIFIDSFGVLVVAFLLILEHEHQAIKPEHRHYIKV